MSGTVGTFRVWASTDPNAFRDASVRASLIDASTREVVRQTLVRVSRSYIPAQHTVTFPRFVVPHGQRLMLQLGVGECQKCHVIYRLANPETGRPNVMLNGVPDAGNGPLALAHMKTRSGLRAGIVGDLGSRIRLALAVVTGALAIFAHPRVVRPLRQIGTAVSRVVRQLPVGARRLIKPYASRSGRDPPSGFDRLLEVPWYPWMAAVAPILHFLASNPLHFEAVEAIIPLAVTLVVVTCSVVGLRLALDDWHRSAAVSAVVIVVVFGYGHIERAIEGKVDDRTLFGVAVILAGAAAVLIIRFGAGADRWTRFLSLMTAVLLVFPAGSLVAETATAKPREPLHENLAAHLPLSRSLDEYSKRPDIYYIILDSYARNDALVDLFGFDNTEFLGELESRGFYVASEATSNYIYTIQSTPSILNLQYLDGLDHRIPETRDDLVDIARYHAIGAILKDLGYTYVHLESGIVSTGVSPLADQVVSFTPSGTLVRTNDEANFRTDAGTSRPLLSLRFIRRLVETTALGPVVGQQFLLGETEPYEWWSPNRTLQMFDFLSNPIEADGPKFVFAHIVKPHDPATFDKQGNYFDDHRGFDDYHDRSVPSAYMGQLIYVNKLVLNMIDGILKEQSDPPIIVIAGDHGRGISRNHRHSILGAFHLPYGGSAGLYASISSVNHFRYILDFYFGLGLGLLEDRTYWHSSDRNNFRK